MLERMTTLPSPFSASRRAWALPLKWSMKKAALLSPLAADGRFALSQARDLDEALPLARAALPRGGVVLLSPGAPSFGLYRDYVARGRRFVELAGFDPAATAGIAGMGIA